MKNKKMMIILLILLTILISLGSVNAADNTTNQTINTDNPSISASDNQNLEKDNVNIRGNNLDSNEAGTFTELQELIDNANGELNLTKNYTYNNMTDRQYHLGVTITKEITINGNGFTLNGNNQSRIFRITTYESYKGVTLINLNFINASVYTPSFGPLYGETDDPNNFSIGNTGAGGAIEYTIGENIPGHLNLTNCTFIHNIGFNGGAISQVTGEIIINNCIFKDNIAYNVGGAVYVGTSSTIENSTFHDNYAKREGGVFYIGTEYGAIYMFNNCFYNNTSKKSSIINNKNNTYYIIMKNFYGDNNPDLDYLISNITEYADGHAILNLDTSFTTVNNPIIITINYIDIKIW